MRRAILAAISISLLLTPGALALSQRGIVAHHGRAHVLHHRRMRFYPAAPIDPLVDDYDDVPLPPPDYEQQIPAAAPQQSDFTPKVIHFGTSTFDTPALGTRPSNWNDRPKAFNPSAYQRNTTSVLVFHQASYQRPSGWVYRRWSFGEFLPAAFSARQYRLTEWWLYELPIPPDGYDWVRYSNDALLVDIDTGKILEAEYDVFY